MLILCPIRTWWMKRHRFRRYLRWEFLFNRHSLCLYLIHSGLFLPPNPKTYCDKTYPKAQSRRNANPKCTSSQFRYRCLQKSISYKSHNE